MDNKTKRIQLPKENYITAGIGAAVGGAAVKGASVIKNSNLSKHITSALTNSNPEEFDTFVKNSNKALARALKSKKGFFGKINKELGPVGFTYNKDAVKQVTKNVTDSYTTRAINKLSGKFTGETLAEETVKLRDKLISRDILKSLNASNRFTRALLILGAAVLGAIVASSIKEVSDKGALANKTEKPASATKSGLNDKDLNKIANVKVGSHQG